MEKNIRYRDLLGAFLGGVAGILATGYVSIIALPFGCTFGVIFGWWHREIIRYTRMIVSRKFAGIKQQVVSTRNVFQTAKEHFAHGVHTCKKFLAKVGHLVQIPFQWVQLPFRNTLNRMWILRMVTIIPLYFVCNSWVFWLVRKSWITADNPSTRNSLLAVLVVWWLLLAIVVTILPIAFYTFPEKLSKKYVRQTMRRYRRTKTKFIRQEIQALLAFEIHTLFLFLGLIFLENVTTWPFVIVTIPVALVTLSARLTIRSLKREGHLLCLASTLITTGSSALLLHPLFENKQLLWVVALLTGTLAGLMVVSLRPYANRWIIAHPKLEREANVKILKRIAPFRRILKSFKRHWVKWGRHVSSPLVRYTGISF